MSEQNPQNSQNLQNQIALVTGASRGIGRAIALELVRQGAKVVGTATSAAGAAAISEYLEQAQPGCGKGVVLNVNDAAACIAVIDDAQKEFGGLSILVNNAGITRRNAFTAETETVAKDWNDIISLNLNGVFNVTQAFLAPLRASKGRIVNIGSIQSFVHLRTPSSAAYTTSKHGVLGFTKALAAELGKEGVRVNAIGPGFIETNINANVRATNPALVQAFVDHTPLARTGKPEDIVGPAIFLASDLSAYVTGTIVMVDGGYRTV